MECERGATPREVNKAHDGSRKGSRERQPLPYVVVLDCSQTWPYPAVPRPKEDGKRVGSSTTSTTRVGEVSEQGRGERRLRRGIRRGWEYALAEAGTREGLSWAGLRKQG